MSNLSDPKNYHLEITPSDTVNFTKENPCAVLKVLTSGNLAIVDIADNVVIYPVAAGELIQFRAKRINSTGTTATVVHWWD